MHIPTSAFLAARYFYVNLRRFTKYRGNALSAQAKTLQDELHKSWNCGNIFRFEE